MKPSPDDTHWADSKNWKWHLVYVCKDDPRIIVPKKPKWMGRTLNFAHPKAYLVLAFTFLFSLSPLLLLPYLELKHWIAFFLAIIAAIITFYYCCELRVKEKGLSSRS